MLMYLMVCCKAADVLLAVRVQSMQAVVIQPPNDAQLSSDLPPAEGSVSSL